MRRRNAVAAYGGVRGDERVVSMKLPAALQAPPKRTGLKGPPKGICTDRNIGTWKGWSMERIAAL